MEEPECIGFLGDDDFPKKPEDLHPVNAADSSLSEERCLGLCTVDLGHEDIGIAFTANKSREKDTGDVKADNLDTALGSVEPTPGDTERNLDDMTSYHSNLKTNIFDMEPDLLVVDADFAGKESSQCHIKVSVDDADMNPRNKAGLFSGLGSRHSDVETDGGDVDMTRAEVGSSIGDEEATLSGIGGVGGEDSVEPTDSSIATDRSCEKTNLINLKLRVGDLKIGHSSLEAGLCGGMDVTFENVKMSLGDILTGIAELELDLDDIETDIGCFEMGVAPDSCDISGSQYSNLQEASSERRLSYTDDINRSSGLSMAVAVSQELSSAAEPNTSTRATSMPECMVLHRDHVLFRDSQLQACASLLSSSLPDKFPSFLLTSHNEAGRQQAAPRCDLPSGGAVILAMPPTTHSPSSPSPLLRQYQGKSKLDLNLSSSKSSLNFRSLDAAGTPQTTTRSLFSEGETSRGPRCRFKSWGAGSDSLLDCDVTRAAAAGSQRPPQSSPSVPVVVPHRGAGPGTDGRHVLNYGTEGVLDDMLSEIRMLSQESESEAETLATAAGADEQDVGARKPAVGNPGQRSRQRPTKTVDKKSGKRRKKKKHDLDEVDGNTVTPVEDALTCPVCLDVFYSAHMVRPCGHTFCEPCLRRLAKYSQDASRITTCPVCRNPIDSCVRNTDVSNKVAFYCMDDYRRRHRLEKNNKYMRHPLPSSDPATFSARHQLSRIVSRLDRHRLARRRARSGPSPFRVDCRRFLSLAFGFVLFKSLLLMSLLCLYCAVYDHALHEWLLELSVSGVLALVRPLGLLTPKLWGFAGVFLFGCVFVVVLKLGNGNVSWKKPLHEQNQRIALS